MTRPEHWEPPEPVQVLVSARRVAAELDVPLWKAQEICWSLDRRYYSQKGKHYRVTRVSLDAFEELLEQGLSISAARTFMWQVRQDDWLPTGRQSPVGNVQRASLIRRRRRSGRSGWH